jgi:hypothetical protein
MMYLGWTISVGGVAGYGLARDIPTMVAIGIVAGGFSAIGQAIWGTMMHTLVPNEVLGRVYSLDMLTAAGILPVANAVAGIAASAFGARPTLIVAGVFSAAVNLVFLFAWRGMRGSESDGSMRPSDALA